MRIELMMEKEKCYPPLRMQTPQDVNLGAGHSMYDRALREKALGTDHTSILVNNLGAELGWYIFDYEGGTTARGSVPRLKFGIAPSRLVMTNRGSWQHSSPHCSSRSPRASPANDMPEVSLSAELISSVFARTLLSIKHATSRSSSPLPNLQKLADNVAKLLLTWNQLGDVTLSTKELHQYFITCVDVSIQVYSSLELPMAEWPETLPHKVVIATEQSETCRLICFNEVYQRLLKTTDPTPGILTDIRALAENAMQRLRILNQWAEDENYQFVLSRVAGCSNATYTYKTHTVEDSIATKSEKAFICRPDEILLPDEMQEYNSLIDRLYTETSESLLSGQPAPSAGDLSQWLQNRASLKSVARNRPLVIAVDMKRSMSPFDYTFSTSKVFMDGWLKTTFKD